jgi:hypothetical protein
LLEVQTPAELQGGVHGGLLSTFSSPVDVDRHLEVWTPPEHNEEGCAPFSESSDVASKTPTPGSVVIVRRGKCAFIEKAQHAQDSQAKGIIIISDVDEVLDMDGNGSAVTLSIFALSVKRSVGDKLIASNVIQSTPPV